MFGIGKVTRAFASLAEALQSLAGTVREVDAGLRQRARLKPAAVEVLPAPAAKRKK